MKVGLCYNLKKELSSVENEDEPPLPVDFFAECDSDATISAIRDALAERHEVQMIEADEHAFEKFRTSRPEIVFNVAEGVFGQARESQVPCMLEMLRIPYTGSDPVTLAICLDKARTKEILAYHKVPTPKMQVMDTPDAKLEGLRFPVIVKPLQEGSSKGIVNDSVVRDRAALKKQLARVMGLYRQPALVEEYLPGREFTVALIGNGSKLQVLPIVEIKFDTLPGKANPIYSFEAKWVWDVPEAPLDIFECPAKVPNDLKSEIEEVCRRAFNVLNCRDWCRIDVRLDARGRANVLELNPLPGILPKPEDNSCFPKAARAAGMTYSKLINRVLDVACERHGLGGARKRAGVRGARSAVSQSAGFAK